MKKNSWIMLALVATGFVASAPNAEAKVRDPISRKTSPERGFFESRPSSSYRPSATYARGTVISSPTVVSRQGVNSSGVVIKSGETISAPAAPKYRSRYIRVR